MITFKCKMCGGDLHPKENATTCECEYCGSVQTIPTADNEKKGNLFNRANRLRMAAEYDKAAAVYASITAEFPEEAEAYWGLCLCKYGIEYVEDPTTAKKIPTCHRTRSESIMDDADFDQACENADAIAKRVYREEAKAIDRLQQDILSVVASESPYDVFICYKETGEDGSRTEDSVLAQDVYDALTTKGLKVFFARITLEDKLGRQYEPYIYAALHSAKVMLSIGTQFEYFDAVWVKNEWVRFLDMMKSDKDKTLIPCYKGIDAYDMPREFKNLQAQDMGKLGWLQDLTRGVMKLCGKEEIKSRTEIITQQIVSSGSPTAESLLKRAFVFLEDSQWDRAGEYADKVLDIDVENGQAYLVKLLAELKLKRPDDLANQEDPFDGNKQYEKIMRFGDDALKQQITSYHCSIEARRKQAETEKRLAALTAMLNRMSRNNDVSIIKEIESVEEQLEQLPESDTVQSLKKRCQEERERIADNQRKKKQHLFDYAKKMCEGAKSASVCKYALQMLQGLKDFENAESIVRVCNEKMEAFIQRDSRIEEAVESLKKEHEQKEEKYREARVIVQLNKTKLDQAEDEVNQLKRQAQSLQNELSQLKGLFTGKRRKELETQINDVLSKVRAAQANCEKCKQVFIASQNDLPVEPQENELKYNIAAVYAREGVYDGAARLYLEIADYRNVAEILKTEPYMVQKNKEQSIKEPVSLFSDNGTSFYFGRYDQDGWKDCVEWVVLDTQGKYMLLVSRYALDVCTAEEEALNKWTRKFYDTAFDPLEQAAVVDTSAIRLSDWNDDGRQQNKVFLLTREEFERYIHLPEERKHTPTPYAVSKGAPERCWGWLWPKAVKNHQSGIVTSSGGFSTNHIDRIGAVRPALWLDAEKLNAE